MNFHVEGKYDAKYDTEFLPKVFHCSLFDGMQSAQNHNSNV